MDENIEAIIFDFGGVLIDIDYTKTTAELAEFSEKTSEQLFSQSEQTEIFDLYERGQISSQNFINRLLAEMKPGTTANKVVQAWNAMIGEIAINNVQFVRTLKSNYKIFMLSNTNQLHIDLAFRKWKKAIGENPQNLFDRIFLSHEIGMRKPDVNTFKYVCKELGLEPNRALFIDDSPQHVTGAKSAGLKAIQLKNINLLQELIS